MSPLTLKQCLAIVAIAILCGAVGAIIETQVFRDVHINNFVNSFA